MARRSAWPGFVPRLACVAEFAQSNCYNVPKPPGMMKPAVRACGFQAKFQHRVVGRDPESTDLACVLADSHSRLAGHYTPVTYFQRRVQDVIVAFTKRHTECLNRRTENGLKHLL